MENIESMLPILMFALCAAGLAVLLLAMGLVFNPWRTSRVKEMPYESGMDPIHDTRRRFDVRFHLLAIAFLVFDVELLFLYPWAVSAAPARVAAAVSVESAEQTPPLTETQQAASAALRSPDFPAGGEFVQNRRLVFGGVMVFVALLVLGFVYDWRKGIFEWR